MTNTNSFYNFNKNAMTTPTFRFECVITQLDFIILSLKNEGLKKIIYEYMTSIKERMYNLRYQLVEDGVEGNNYSTEAIFLAARVYKKMAEATIYLSSLSKIIDEKSEDYGPLMYFIEVIGNKKYLLGNDELEEMSENEPETI